MTILEELQEDKVENKDLLKLLEKLCTDKNGESL